MRYTVISGLNVGIGIILIILKICPFLGQAFPPACAWGPLRAIPEVAWPDAARSNLFWRCSIGGDASGSTPPGSSTGAPQLLLWCGNGDSFADLRVGEDHPRAIGWILRSPALSQASRTFQCPAKSSACFFYGRGAGMLAPLMPAHVDGGRQPHPQAEQFQTKSLWGRAGLMWSPAVRCIAVEPVPRWHEVVNISGRRFRSGPRPDLTRAGRV